MIRPLVRLRRTGGEEKCKMKNCGVRFGGLEVFVDIGGSGWYFV